MTRSVQGGVALLGLLIGCQASTEPEAVAPQRTPVQSESTADVRNVALAAPSLTTKSDLTSSNMSGRGGITSPHDAAAERAFATLTTPGITLEDWDAAQQELLELGSRSATVLAGALRSESPLQRETAATTLVLLGPEAAELATTELLQALNDNSDFVRANAAAALIQVPEQATNALPTLVNLLQSKDSGLRQMAAMNLRSQPQAVERYLPEVLSQLDREDSVDVVVPLIELLGAMGPAASSGVSQLQPLVTSGHPEVSQAATAALQQVQGEIQQTQAELPAFE